MNVAHSLNLHSMKILFLLGLILAHSSAIAQTMALGIATQPSAALLQIAVERGLLKDEGIAASVTRYPSGKHALQEGLFTGEVDVHRRGGCGQCRRYPGGSQCLQSS
jgi:ABC-type nitrate/sulfonate/bicarbonate transport system substrate-binding protein